MFGIGVQELAIIFVIALLIFGPKRLPELARTVGKGLAEIRRASGDLRQTFDLSADPPPHRPPPAPSHVPAPEDPRTARELDSRPAQAIDTDESEAPPDAASISNAAAPPDAAPASDATAPDPDAAHEEDPARRAPAPSTQGEKASD